MYYGGGNITKVNNGSKALPFPFVTAYLRGRSDGYALKGGDATQGKLETMYDGPRPNVTIAGTCKQFKFGEKSVYQPMRKQGAIILATGGDQSNRAIGEILRRYHGHWLHERCDGRCRTSEHCCCWVPQLSDPRADSAAAGITPWMLQ